MKATITKGVLSSGEVGVLAIFSEAGTEVTFNTAVEQILGLGFKNIEIRGNLSSYADLKGIILGIANKGKYVTFVTDSKEDISPIRMPRNIKVILLIDKEFKMHQNNYGILRDTDEVKVIVEDIKVGTELIEALKIKRLTKPMIVFAPVEALRNDFIKYYLEVVGSLTFRSKIW